MSSAHVCALEAQWLADFASIAIQIGGIGTLAPERRGDLAKLGLRAMLAGLIACYLFAAVVGVLKLTASKNTPP